MKDDGCKSVAQVHRNADAQAGVAPPAHEPPAIDYTELPDGSADSPIASEWKVYRREVGRLLAEGHENRWVLIKGVEIIGIGTPRKTLGPSPSSNS
jgi:hypothetical protein